MLMAAMPWIRWSRFSLRTLLIATTLVAVVLGRDCVRDEKLALALANFTFQAKNRRPVQKTPDSKNSCNKIGSKCHI